MQTSEIFRKQISCYNSTDYNFIYYSEYNKKRSNVFKGELQGYTSKQISRLCINTWIINSPLILSVESTISIYFEARFLYISFSVTVFNCWILQSGFTSCTNPDLTLQMVCRISPTPSIYIFQPTQAIVMMYDLWQLMMNYYKSFKWKIIV